ncbi:polar amino acid transport system permease protein [Tistlia consotensis]|uniref:Glutamate/aspartate import permease protein GltK n=1 Tax=Tistlia consotensis USBA 355 TaxID=560819 RepID=A0A1Y6B2P2_9PROT|nr:amino acid ABC transporter permease [Tistlia consotensis]SME88430.1 polar amino acid transport system permease protein [Tistlia consotensis USBA 355]SNR24882.1 polar amino acid transport system permease protein [Tistlia consotensis]
MDHVWDFTSVIASRKLLLIGLLHTVELGVLCLVLGLTAGAFVGAARYSRNRWVNWPASAFVEVFRNTPALVQIIWFYFAFPILVPIDIDPFLAATLGLSLNTTAFAAEIYRGGIQSLGRGQWEAARALGMTYGQQLTRIILPQAVKRMVPAFMNRAVELMKMTSLASVIAYGELMHQAKTISTYNFNPIETYTVVALIFFALIYPLALAMQQVERRLRRSE